MRFQLAALACALLPTAALAGDDTLGAIEAAVFDYFEGQSERSEERLSRAFAVDTTQMVGITMDEGGMEITSRPIAEMVEAWSRGEPSGEKRTGRIVGMDVVEDRLATVLFDSNGRFYDALTLAKVGGEWKIVSKVYVIQGETEGQ
jgi:hypothetical protein